MNKVKEVISENKVLLLMILVIIAIGISFSIIDFIRDNKSYNSGLNTNENVLYLEKKYGDNEYKVMRMDEIDIIQLYYKDYLYKMIDSSKEAWNITFQNGENKSTDFKNSFEEYKKTIDGRITKSSKTNVVKKYSKKEEPSYNIITVIDSENYMYEIYEYGVWKYKVAFKGQVKAE